VIGSQYRLDDDAFQPPAQAVRLANWLDVYPIGVQLPRRS